MLEDIPEEDQGAIEALSNEQARIPNSLPGERRGPVRLPNDRRGYNIAMDTMYNDNSWMNMSR